MARYDDDRRSRRSRNDDRYDADRSYRTRDRDDFDDERAELRRELRGYDREDGKTRWDYAGRGPVDDVRNYPEPDRGLREREDLDGDRRRAYRDRDDRNEYGYRGRYTGDDRRRDDGDRYESREAYLDDRYDRDYNRDYARDFGDDNVRGRYEGHRLGRDRRDDGPHVGVGPEGYTRSPERMVESVSDRLMDDGRVDASAIRVSAEGTEVTLEGTVPSRAQKRRAEDLAESVRGVDDVHNRLTIRRDDDA